MGDRRREQRNRRVPTKSSRQGEVGEPQRENLGIDARRVPEQFHRGGARGRSRRERMPGPGHDVPQGAGDPLEVGAVRKIEEIGGGSQNRVLERPRAGREQAPQPMDAAGRAGGRVRAGVGRKMLGLAQRGRILAMTRHGGAGGGGAQRQALAQRAGERRIKAKNLVEQGEPSAGVKSRLEARVGADGRLFRRPRPGRKRLFQQWVGRRETRRGEPARPPPRHGDRRLAARIGGRSFVGEDVRGRESDHAQA